MTDCNSQLALGSNQQCQEHQRQQQPLISNITVLQIIICSKEAAPFNSQAGTERNMNGCSHILQFEDNLYSKRCFLLYKNPEARAEGDPCHCSWNTHGPLGTNTHNSLRPGWIRP